MSLAVIFMVVSANAQSRFEVKDFGKFKLHTYITADPLGNMSYIIEGNKGLVVLEPAAFIENIKEFGEYATKLNKPIEKVVANYHAAGASGFHDHSTFVMIEGMPEFVKGDAYNGMMNYLASSFGDAMDTKEFKAAQTVKPNAKTKWAGVDFKFTPGSSSDFPASSILISGKAYYIHFTPVADMHMGALQITGRDAVDAYLAELKNAKASGAETFIGGHGMGIADKVAVDFQIAYLTKVKEVIVQQTTTDGFIAAMKTAYPNIAGEDNLTAIAANIYK